jgi:hypothetical protein
MMKCKAVWLFVTVVTGLCLATAQTSPKNPYSDKPRPDPLQTATKPLTPKVGISHSRKSSVGLPVASTKRSDPNAELNRLESQDIKAKVPKNANTGAVKGTGAKSSTAPSKATSQPTIDAKYQKPTVPKKN